MNDILEKLAKDMECFKDELTLIEVHNCQVLPPISIELIRRHTLKDEVSSNKEDKEMDWR